ncbi:FxSxx-COOH system tetratricopeptide repeat protein [Nonomuraea sp. NPDC049684]|uniref:FxSxx-COOH system tetratricopeptide repeat protein n=1 Tax=Nonomuraea sp. NPDC049684 TaxID=3364356 RepID=UPI00379E924C
MTTLPDPEERPDVQLDGDARERGRVYQAAHDQIINEITQQGPRRPLPPAATVQVPAGLSGLPRRPAAAFVGREAALTALRQTLQDMTGPGVISQAVLGLGGVGKSELALQYAHHHRQEYALVWWIDADRPDLIRAGLAALTRELTCGIDSVAAEQATVEEATAWALSWLAAHPSWLVIFDNVEEVADVEPYLARLSHGHVLITTRRDVGWQHLNITPLRLELLSRPAAIALLADLIGPPDSADTDGLKQLAEQLGDLPLALTQAGAYIARTPRITLRRYLNLLETWPARMYDAATVDQDAERVIAKVWTLSQARLQQVDPLAVQVLNLLAFFAPDNLPCRVLAALPGADELQTDEALALLASYSLITLTTSEFSSEETDDLISVHRLVQAVTRHQLDPGQQAQLREQAADLLLAALPEDPEAPENRPVYQHLLPHARAVLPLDSPGLSRILTYLLEVEDYDLARQLAEQINTHLCDTNHPCALQAQQTLAACVGEEGEAAAARDMLAALLPVRERVSGVEDPSTLLTHYSLARWTGEAGDPAAARDLLAALLPVHERASGVEDPSTLLTHYSLARWTGQAGDPAAARDMLAALLPVRERASGVEDPSTLLTRYSLAHWTGQAGDPAAARDLLAALLPVHERVSGVEDPSTLLTRYSLADWTGQAGDPAAARDLFAALLPIEERVRGAEDPSTLLTHYSLAHWTGQAGDPAAARDLLAALLPVRERVSGVEDPSTLLTHYSLAHWTGQAGDPAAARDLFAALLPIEERVRGAEDPSTLLTHYSLAHWTGEAGDPAAARDLLAALLPVHERVSGVDDPDTVHTRRALAEYTALLAETNEIG